MSFIEVFLVAIGLAMDAFAVSISNGIVLENVEARNAIKFGLFFGVFQFIMPIIGWLCAKNFSAEIESFDHWIAFILLLIIGGKMFFESFKDDDEEIKNDSKILSLKNMTVLAIATSIDALAVGVSFAFLNNNGFGLNIWSASSIIGIVAFALSYIYLDPVPGLQPKLIPLCFKQRTDST